MLDLPSKCLKLFFSLTILFSLMYNASAQTGKDDVIYMTVNASFYCHGSKSCTVKSKGVTATGEKVREGIIAVDPKVIPLRRTIEIVEPEIVAGVYRSSDTGGKRIKGKFIDVWVPTQHQAIKFGIIKNIKLKIYPKGITEDDVRKRLKEKENDVSETIQ